MCPIKMTSTAWFGCAKLPQTMKVMLGLVLLSSLLSGCAGIKTNAVSSDTEQSISADGQIADMLSNLLSVIPQILPTQDTTIQVGPETLRDYRYAAQYLSLQGYGLQYVDADQGRHFLRIEELQDDFAAADKTLSIRVSVGAIELTRSYQILKRSFARAGAVEQGNPARISIVPNGPLKLAGTRQNVTIDDSIFVNKLAANSSISSVEYASAAPILGGIPTISLITNDVVDRVVSQASNGPTVQALNASKVEVSNRYYNSGSSFGSIYDSYDRIRRETVVFANDSMRLGELGKRRVRNLLADFSERSDVFSIVGCSNGPTKLAIGNEGLALGRAARISDELLSLGVAREKIYDEGCWGPNSTGSRFPGRGVVIELWRRPV